MTLIEMEGFLRGKCLPGDILVGETNAQYLLRKLNAATELQRQLTACEATVTNLTAQVQGLAAESAALKATNDDRRMFIMNGVQLGYIKVPTVETDPALETIRIAVSPQEQTPATDAALAEIRNEARAEGINFAAGRLAAAFNNGFIDKPLTEVFDVTRMILTAKEDIANEPAADGLSGEYAKTSLKQWEEQLRKEQGK